MSSQDSAEQRRLAWVYHTSFTGEQAEIEANDCVQSIVAGRIMLAKAQLQRLRGAGDSVTESWLVFVTRRD